MGTCSARGLTPLHEAACYASAVAACTAISAGPAWSQAVQHIAVTGYVSPRCWTALPREAGSRPTAPRTALVQCSGLSAVIRLDRPKSDAPRPGRVTVTPKV